MRSLSRAHPSAALSVAAVFLGVILAGCLSDADSTGQAGQGASELFDEGTGAIEGVVLTEDLQPIEGALVAILELGKQANTTAAGRFVFDHVPPGQHRVVAQAIGFAGLARTVEVVTGKVVQAQFTLDALPTVEPYFETFAFVGFEACQWYVGGALSTCTLPYAQAYGFAKNNGVNLSNYGLPENPLPDNDKYNFTLWPDHTKVVSELIWEAASAGATHQVLIIACGWWDPVWDECVPPGSTTTGVRYFSRVGTSPIRMEWEHPNPDALPWVMARANVNGNFSDGKPAGFALEQRIEMFNTAFYGALPPPGFTAGRPDQ